MIHGARHKGTGATPDAAGNHTYLGNVIRVVGNQTAGGGSTGTLDAATAQNSDRKRDQYDSMNFALTDRQRGSAIRLG